MIQSGQVIPIGDDEEQLQRKSGLYLYIWGAVYYDDGFGAERITRFCHRYNSNDLKELREPPGLGGAPKFIGYEIAAEDARYHLYGSEGDLDWCLRWYRR